jgi:protein tyrosine phosphatase (PTP) superfamily phosphohydrolase (DUF442 family)
MEAASRARRLLSRRNLLRLAGAASIIGLCAEAGRVLFGTNVHTVIPGRVYRSAQLDGDNLTRFIEEKGIRTVVNLRGTGPSTEWYMAEARATHAAGICQEDISLSAKRLPAPDEIRRLIDVLDHTDYPIVAHCQQGADRTGLVATAALLLMTDATVAEARRQLWPRYGHISAGRTAVIDRFFDFYEAWLESKGKAHTSDLFRYWATREYCPGPYRAKLTLLGPAPEIAAGRGFTLTIRAENISIEPWTFHPGAAGGIRLRYQLYTPQGTRLYIGHAGHLGATVPPGEFISLAAGFPPVAAPGKYVVHADLLDSQAIDLHDSAFVQYGSEPLILDIQVK